jgi:hypothetical protein
MQMKRWILAGALAAAALTTVSAQEKPAPQEKPTPPQMVTPSRRQPLKVQFVIARYQGDKRLSSMPYTLGVLSDAGRTSMRLGIAVPIATGPGPNVSTYNYKDVGTNIDCSASDQGNGLYQLVVTISDSSVQSDAGEKDAKFVRDVPVFRNFNATFTMLLRDGQTMQYASVTDPVSGEVTKIDVTLNFAK